MAKTSTRSTTRPSSPPKRKQTQTSEDDAPAPAVPTSEVAPSTNGASFATLDGATTTSRAAERTTPSHEQIAARAYELYVTRGGGEGQAMSDWLRAEGELRH